MIAFMCFLQDTPLFIQKSWNWKHQAKHNLFWTNINKPLDNSTIWALFVPSVSKHYAEMVIKMFSDPISSCDSSTLSHVCNDSDEPEETDEQMTI